MPPARPLREVSLPVGFTTFPGEIFRAPRSWVEKAYPNLIYFNEVDKGGHFAAWEEPELFATEIRAAFRTAPGRGSNDLTAAGGLRMTLATSVMPRRALPQASGRADDTHELKRS